MPAGVFITLEGVEGSGKTTQAAILGDALRKDGRRVTVTHEPGGTRAGETIRAIFLDPAVSLDVAAELLLVLADRAQHVREKLRPALASGEIVISDRYSDSTTAYQGYARGVDLKVLGELNRLATDNVTPDLTIVLDLPVETGLERTRARAKGTGPRLRSLRGRARGVPSQGTRRVSRDREGGAVAGRRDRRRPPGRGRHRRHPPRRGRDARAPMTKSPCR